MTGPWFISQFKAQLIYWYGSEGYNIYGQLLDILMLGHIRVFKTWLFCPQTILFLGSSCMVPKVIMSNESILWNDGIAL